MTTKTKEQIEHVKTTRFVCRGALLRDEKAQGPYFRWWYAAEEKDDRAAAIALIEELEAERKKIAAKNAPGYMPQPLLAGPGPDDEADPRLELDWAQLRRKAFPLIRLRTSLIGRPCGRNLIDQILEAPFDGAVHPYRCPKCGNEGTFRAPLFYAAESESDTDKGD